MHYILYRYFNFFSLLCMAESRCKIYNLKKILKTTKSVRVLWNCLVYADDMGFWWCFMNEIIHNECSMQFVIYIYIYYNRFVMPSIYSNKTFKLAPLHKQNNIRKNRIECIFSSFVILAHCLQKKNLFQIYKINYKT